MTTTSLLRVKTNLYDSLLKCGDMDLVCLVIERIPFYSWTDPKKGGK